MTKTIDWKAAEHWGRIVAGADHLIAGEGMNKLTYIVSGHTLALPMRLHVYSGGESQHGKSAFQRAMGSLFYPNFREVNTASAKAHYYEAKENSACLKHSVRMFDEVADQSQELRVQLKALTSQGTDTVKMSTVTVQRQHLEVDIKGLPVVWLNSASSASNEQLMNRFLKTNIDESIEQDGLVDAFQTVNQISGTTPSVASPPVERARETIESILEVRDIGVCNPFANQWKITGARNIRPMIGTIVSGIAYINRFTRQMAGRKIVASASDNLLAYDIWKACEEFQITGLPGRFANLYDAMAEDEEFTAKQLASLIGKNGTTARIYANELVEEGYLTAFTRYPDGTKLWSRGSHTPRTSVVYAPSDELLAESLKGYPVHITEAQLQDDDYRDTVYTCTGVSPPTHTGSIAQGGVHRKCTGVSQVMCTGDSQVMWGTEILE